MKTSSEDWKQDFTTQPSKEEWYGTKFVKGKKSVLQNYINLFEG